MANGLPTRIGALGRGIERGLGIGQMLQQREILGQQQILAQKEAEQKETQQRFDNDIRLLDALRSAGASDETLGSFIENKIAPNVDGLLDDTDLTGRGKELANFLSRASADYAKHGDINLFEQVITQGVSKIPRKGRGFETQAQSEGARLAQAADIQAALAGPGREQVLAGGGPQAVTELLGRAGETGQQLLAERLDPERRILAGVTIGEETGTLQETAPGSGEFEVLTIGGEPARGPKKAGVQINLGKPASASERTAIAETRASIDALNNLSSLYDRSFVGPIAGRAGRVRNFFGLAPQQQAEFLAATAAFKNQVIKDITGAQMSEKEAARILSQVPTELDVGPAWTAKRNQTIQNLQRLNARRKEVLRQSALRVPEDEMLQTPADLQNLSDEDLLKELGR